MKLKDYLNALVSKRKGSAQSSSSSSSKSHQKAITNTKTHQEASADCHYDVCGYDDSNNGLVIDDQHSRTQILLARHAELVNTIVGTRSQEIASLTNTCPQCRAMHQHQHPSIPLAPPLPPPLPPKQFVDHQVSFANRNYSSTLATCSPRRECQQTHHPIHSPSSQYSTPNNSNVMSSSNSSLWINGTSSKKQRSRIKTNPWIGTSLNRPSTIIEPQPLPPPEYCIYDPTFFTSPPSLIHSESFPQTTPLGYFPIASPPTPPPPPPPPPPPVLHQSDSGHGFSLSSSRVIDSSPSSSPPSTSSSPDNTSGDRRSSLEKKYYHQKRTKKKIPIQIKSSPKRNEHISHHHSEQYFYPTSIASDGDSLTRRSKAHRISPPVTLQYRYQRPSTATISSPLKSPVNRVRHPHHSRSSSPRSFDDRFSLEFEEIVENERSHNQQRGMKTNGKYLPSPLSPASSHRGASPFILPLDETTKTKPSSSTLTKTNSRTILKHIEEIENEIRMIKNLDIADDDENDESEEEEEVLSPRAYPEEDIDLDGDQEEQEKSNDRRQSIYEQVDQWVENCLKTTNSCCSDNPANRLHTECDRLSNTIKDYVVCVCSDDRSSIPPTNSEPITTTKMMTAFYLSSTPTTRRTSSFIDEPTVGSMSGTMHNFKTIQECPF